MAFTFEDHDLAILKNFAGINPSILIKPDKISVINSAKSLVGAYVPAEPYDFAEFGIYEMSDFLAALNTLKSPSIEVNDRYLLISDGEQKFKYFTTAKDLLPSITLKEDKVDQQDFDLDFDMSAEKFSILMKSASIVKATNIFFETVDKRIIITVVEELNSSNNSFEIPIEEGIRVNKLEKPVSIPISDLRLCSGDYSVKVCSKISKWTNMSANLNYYIGVNASK